MSEHWTVYCQDCLRYGPDIRRSGSVTLQGYWPRRHPALAREWSEMNAADAWKGWLDEHGWHRLHLVHE